MTPARASLRLAGAAITLCALAAGPGGAETTAIRPLVEIYSINNAKRPDAYFAWIRCAALVYAQESWRTEHHRGDPVSAGRKREAERYLEQAQRYRAHRPVAGISYVDAVSDDIIADADHYLAQFDANAARGAEPWSKDPLIESELAYCAAFAKVKAAQ